MEEGDSKLFADRAEELDLLESSLASLREGNRMNLCFSGVPGSGRTAILRRYMETRAHAWIDEGVVLVYLPLAEFAESCAGLCLDFVSHVAAAFLTSVGAQGDASACSPRTPSPTRRAASAAAPSRRSAKPTTGSCTRGA